MRYLLVLLLVVFSTSPARAALDQATLIALGASVLKVEARRAQGGYALGSGVVVAADMVVTNCHVTRDARAIYVLRGGRRWRVDSQASDIDHDLCVLHVPEIEATPVALGASLNLGLGQAVAALGYTGGLGLQYSGGNVVALHRMDGGRVVQSSNAFSSGASGGALFDEAQRLVGILTFRLRGGVAHYFAAPVEWVKPMLGAHSAFQAVAPLDALRRPYWQRPLDDQPQFLRAAVLEREDRWDELEMLAFNWTRVDADDARPWYLHGLALNRLLRWPESQRALERSLTLEPASKEAWFRLGMVCLEQGKLGRARQARDRLEVLSSPDLAAELGRAIAAR